MIKKILLGLAAMIVLILIVAAFQSSDFRVKRSAKLSASPMALFAHVNDHHKFALWNPWMKLDPNVKNTYAGPDAGVGAACSWEGDSNVGAGTSTIIESKPGELVRFRMDWRKPMEGTSTVDFTFQPQGNETLVTWEMYGPRNYMGKLVSLFIDCDKMCGDQFEKGLTNLGEAASKTPAVNTTALP